MPRPRSASAIRSEAARFEPRLARAVRRAAERLRDTVSINALAMALAAKDVKRAEALLSIESIEDAFAPVGTMARDAVLKGGRLGAAQVREALA